MQHYYSPNPQVESLAASLAGKAYSLKVVEAAQRSGNPIKFDTQKEHATCIEMDNRLRKVLGEAEYKVVIGKVDQATDDFFRKWQQEERAAGRLVM